jgi:hypothetical protein
VLWAKPPAAKRHAISNATTANAVFILTPPKATSELCNKRLSFAREPLLSSSRQFIPIPLQIRFANQNYRLWAQGSFEPETEGIVVPSVFAFVP